MPYSPQNKISSALAAIWQRNQPQVLERLDTLDRAAHAHPLPASLQQEAAATAHKLAGTLGMFGFTRGTEIARELEQHLELAQPNTATLVEQTRRLREAIFPEGSN